MNKSRRSLLVACSVVLVCLAVIVGGTFALFTDKVQVRHHLKAGKLDITLIRTNLKTTTLDNSTGYLVDKSNPQDVDFSKTTVDDDDNIFDITDDLILVPGTSFEAEMMIGNNVGTDDVDGHASNVAYAYWIEIVFEDPEDKLALADQLKVTVNDTTHNKSVSKYLSVDSEDEDEDPDDGLTLGSSTDPIGTLAVGGSASFTVTVVFEDLKSGNNSAMNDEVSFDLVVNAVQVKRS